MPTTALITGATGFIGSWLAEALLAKRFKVKALIRSVSSKENLMGTSMEFVKADYDDLSSLEAAVEDAHYIFHVAGVTKALSAAEYHKGNVIATENLLKAAKNSGKNLKKFIHISSGAAAGPSSSAERPIDETAECFPVTLYGKSKRDAEIACIKMMKELPITVLRPSIIYGPRDKDLLEHFKTVKAGFVPIFGVGVEKKYDYLYVEDLIEGIVAAAESSKTSGEIYFLSGDAHSWREVGETAKKVLGKSFTISLPLPDVVSYGVAAVVEDFNRWQGKISILNRDRARDGAQRFWTFSTVKAKRDFGFIPKTSLEKGFIKTVNWYKEKGWL
ncbi:MAG: NAD-dependent epimerase/dehydratase family protein [Chloroherpetonaceae bacterium]|nr:NAD-dependent epimerase/dehydratase family protein [Chloroherpetonaceae bacterium]